MAAIFHSMARIDTILIDLSRDMWQYISMDYFKLAVVKVRPCLFFTRDWLGVVLILQRRPVITHSCVDT